jgi:AAA domain (dynein-related subfamily)
MTIALFVESDAGELDSLPAHAQTLIFGYNEDIHIYHRVSNGSKGKGQAWKKTDVQDLPNTPIDNIPVGVTLTDRDLALADLGQITNVSIKAIYANENADPIKVGTVSHKDMVTNLFERILRGDSTLADYVLDKRTASGMAQGVTIEPVNKVMPAQTAEPIEQPTTNQPQLEKENTMAMNMITTPDPKWGKQYINRRFNGVTDWDILDHALENDTNVLLEGQAGSGKTICVQGYASARGMRYFNVSNNNGIDPSQLFGRWVPNPTGMGYVWQDGAVTLLVRYGGVLLLNEVNFLPPRVSTVLFSLLDYRREIQLLENGGEVIKAHKDLIIVADMNYGYKGTQELNQAFSDRFGIKLEFPYDRNIENKVVRSKAILTLADQLREQYDKEELSTPISTRSLVSFVNNARAFGVDFSISSFVNGFNKDERNGVRLACETHKDNISQDLGLLTTAHPISQDEEPVVEGAN